MSEDLEEVLSRELRYVLECAFIGDEPGARKKAQQAALVRMAARAALDEQLKPIVSIPLLSAGRSRKVLL